MPPADEHICRTKLLTEHGDIIEDFALPNNTAAKFVSFSGDTCPFNLRFRKRDPARYERGRVLLDALMRANGKVTTDLRRGGFCFSCGNIYSTDMRTHLMAKRDRDKCSLSWLSSAEAAQVDAARKAWAAEEAPGDTSTNAAAAIMTQSAQQFTETKERHQKTDAKVDHLLCEMRELRQMMVAQHGTPVGDDIKPQVEEQCTFCLQAVTPGQATSECTAKSHKYHTACLNHWTNTCGGLSEEDMLLGKKPCVLCTFPSTFIDVLAKPEAKPVPEPESEAVTRHDCANNTETCIADPNPETVDEDVVAQVQSDEAFAKLYQQRLDREDEARRSAKEEQNKGDEELARKLQLEFNNDPPPKRQRRQQ